MHMAYALCINQEDPEERFNQALMMLQTDSRA